MAADTEELDLAADEFYAADDPDDVFPDSGPVPPGGPDPGMADEERALGADATGPADSDPGPGPEDATPEAPFGYTVDRVTGERRPRKRPGRPSRLARQAAGASSATSPAEDAPSPPAPPPGGRQVPIEREPDEPPTAPSASHARMGSPRPPESPGALDSAEPMPRGGYISKRVNRLYRRAGKILRGFDHDIGSALIEITRADPPEHEGDEPDLTVGEAWENLCAVNPRVRTFVLRVLRGGVYGELVMCHAPVALAVIMKPAILRRIPFSRLMASWLEPDDDEEPGEDGEPAGPGGLTLADAAAMAGLNDAAARRVAERMAANINLDDVPPDLLAAAERAAKAANGHGPAPGPRRQPTRQSRAKRKTAGHR